MQKIKVVGYRLIISLFCLVVLVTASGCGNKNSKIDKLVPADAKEVELSGRLRLVGSQPYTALVLTIPSEKKRFLSYHLIGDKKVDLLKHVSRDVKIKGKSAVVELRMADNRVINRHYLKVESYQVINN